MASIHGTLFRLYHARAETGCSAPRGDAMVDARMNPSARPRPLVLVILDGFGERGERADNAVRLAVTPTLAALLARYPHGLIGASGLDVGLPPGQMGNSEVGHLNFGAGRIAVMDISRIDAELQAGRLGTNPAIAGVVQQAKAAGVACICSVS